MRTINVEGTITEYNSLLGLHTLTVDPYTSFKIDGLMSEEEFKGKKPTDLIGMKLDISLLPFTYIPYGVTVL